MDCLINKKGNNAFNEWSTRCYRLRNCELIEYKNDFEDFKLCNDTNIKERYNIITISSISVDPKIPYILNLNDISYQADSINVVLKFNDINKNEIDHKIFTGWYRILCASTKISSNLQCQQRPLPSNICFAIYYLLQKLYKHKQLFNTQFIFNKYKINAKAFKNLPSKIEKLYLNLITRSRDYLKFDQNVNDINLLSQTLLYTLQNMPTSLFCDSHCIELTDFVMNIINNNNVTDEQYQESKAYEDKDIIIFKQKAHLGQIKNFLLKKYSSNKKQYKKQNGFHNFNRYGFLVILFLMLNKISCDENYDKSLMTAADLAYMFAPVLISKTYIFKCRSNQLRDKNYEQNFITSIKILIFYARDLLPDLERVNWKLSTLIYCHGQEKIMSKYYNDQFSKETENKYYIPPILMRNKNYGKFDYTYYKKEEHEEEKNIIQSMPSYNQIPVYHVEQENKQPFYEAKNDTIISPIDIKIDDNNNNDYKQPHSQTPQENVVNNKEEEVQRCSEIFAQCEASNRIKQILKQYNKIMCDEIEKSDHKLQIETNNLINNISFDGQYSSVQLLNDFYHIKYHHNTNDNANQFNSFYKYLFDSDNVLKCNIGHCKSANRYYNQRDRSLISSKNQNTTIKDRYSLDLICRIHTYFIHSYEVSKLTENEIKSVEEQLSQHNEAILDDMKLGLISTIVNNKRMNLSHVIEPTDTSKYITSTMDIAIDHNKVSSILKANNIDVDSNELAHTFLRHRYYKQNLVDDLCDILANKSDVNVSLRNIFENELYENDSDKRFMLYNIIFAECIKKQDLKQHNFIKILKIAALKVNSNLNLDEISNIATAEKLTGKMFIKTSNEFKNSKKFALIFKDIQAWDKKQWQKIYLTMNNFRKLQLTHTNDKLLEFPQNGF